MERLSQFPAEQKAISVKQFSKLMGVSRPHVYKLIERRDRPIVTAITINQKLPVSTKGKIAKAHNAVNIAPAMKTPFLPFLSEYEEKIN